MILGQNSFDIVFADVPSSVLDEIISDLRGDSLQRLRLQVCSEGKMVLQTIWTCLSIPSPTQFY
jgi:hypothetical protein